MGGSPPPPTTQTAVQQQEFPTELKPYISDILGRGQAVYEQRAEAGYQPYLDPRIAEFDPAQQAAFRGIEGMVGGAEPYFGAAGQQLGLAGQGIGAGQQLTGAAAQTAGAGLGYLDPAAQAIGAGADITAAGLGGIQAGQQQLGRAAGVTAGGLANLLGASAIGQQAGMGVSGAEALGRRGELGLMAGEQMLDPAARLAAASAGDIRGDIGSYMSPYMRQVMDIQKREAIRQSDIAGQADAARAAAAGAFGGSRQAILEAERERNLQQQLGDIEATGMQAAYADAARLAEAQRARELAASGQFGQIAGQAGQLGLGRGQLAGTLGGLAGQRAGLAQLQADIARTRGTLGGQLAGIGGQQVGAGQAYGQLGTQLGGLGTQLAGLTSQTTDVARTLGGLGQTAGQLAGQRGTLAGQLSALGTGRQAQTAQELAALEAVGRTRQLPVQTALDQAYQQFIQEQEYPMQTLQDYSSLIRGFYKAPTTYTQTQTTTPAPSALQQIATGAGIGLGLYGRSKAGGKVDHSGGLGSIVVKRSNGGPLDFNNMSVSELTKALGGKLSEEDRAKAYKALLSAKSSSSSESKLPEDKKVTATTDKKQKITLPSTKKESDKVASLESLFKKYMDIQSSLLEEQKKTSAKKRELLEKKLSDPEKKALAQIGDRLIQYGMADPELSESQKIATAFEGLGAEMQAAEEEQQATELALEDVGAEERQAELEGQKSLLALALQKRKIDLEGQTSGEDLAAFITRVKDLNLKELQDIEKTRLTSDQRAVVQRIMAQKKGVSGIVNKKGKGPASPETLNPALVTIKKSQ